VTQDITQPNKSSAKAARKKWMGAGRVKPAKPVAKARVSKKKINTEPETTQEWAEKYSRNRGHDWEFARDKCGAELVTGGFTSKPGIRYPNYDPFTKVRIGDGNVRLQHPFENEKGKLTKFLRPTGKGTALPYFARTLDWARILKDPKVELIISEGETRSIAGAKHGFAIISIPGIDCAFEPGSEKSKLREALRDKRIKWKGRKVTIIPDADVDKNDRVRTSADALARLLSTEGAEVHTAKVPAGVTQDGKAGIDDLLAKPYGSAMLRDIRANAQKWNAETAANAKPSIERLADVEARSVTWLWHQRLPLGMLAGIEGNPGDGKTTLSLHFAAEGSRGRQPYSGRKCEPFNTLYMSIENVTALSTKQRFQAMSGDENKFFVLNGALDTNGKERSITLADVHVIEQAIVKTKAKLVIIDPLQSYMGAHVDSHKANETRPLLDGLARLAERHDVCILIVRHLAKGSGNRAVHRGLGSIDIAGAMRSVMMVGTAPDDPRNRALVHTKSNVGPLTESLRFSIEGKDAAARIVWRGTSRLTAADLAAPDGPKRQSKADLAADYLFEKLQDGPVPIKKLVAEGEFDLRTLQRAALKIRVIRSGREGESGGWLWELPKFATVGVGAKTVQ
jgi:KaiC/GvpD/RAD55 family RecA-like ATPase